MLRNIALSAFIVLLVSAESFAKQPKLTIYDDGLSCPASCDSHVVFHRTLNGTKHAHKPGTEAEKCVSGFDCEICFDHFQEECIDVMYRGSGPGEHTFDLTPAFYVDWCSRTYIPQMLKLQCKSLQRAAESLSERINCFEETASSVCSDLISNAEREKRADIPKYQKCKEIGQSAYNRSVPTVEQRAHGCSYENARNGGPNSNGLRWRKLLPGACRDNTYVGRDGLDCCSGIPLADGALGVECRVFYPRP